MSEGRGDPEQPLRLSSLDRFAIARRETGVFRRPMARDDDSAGPV
jgi:hypothetical protein